MSAGGTVCVVIGTEWDMLLLRSFVFTEMRLSSGACTSTLISLDDVTAVVVAVVMVVVKVVTVGGADSLFLHSARFREISDSLLPSAGLDTVAAAVVELDAGLSPFSALQSLSTWDVSHSFCTPAIILSSVCPLLSNFGD